ncbi:MAG: CoA transferase, partial [Nevskia sp.]|nr:CoA transferase [Nevskia sp.]
MSAAASPIPGQPHCAAAYAAQLLRSLGATPIHALSAPAEHPAVAWATCGLMQLTGEPGGAPTMCPAPLTACADGALAALASLAPAGALAGLRGSSILAERAAIMRLHRAGARSPGGACRLYPARDGWIALNLAREDDWALLPAWLELEQPMVPAQLPELIAGRAADELVERGRLLGLAVAADAMPESGPGWFSVLARGVPVPAPRKAPRVLELSSLWAGPLCGRLLLALGADVVKLESPQRPDGARHGHPAFFDRLNGGKRCVALDPQQPAGRERFRALIAAADIVIEGSRPRALRQLGIDAEAMVRERPGLTWLSLTGYGRGEPQENWIAYGDDAAVAAGLSGLLHAVTGQRLIVGDAIADPLTGLHAALAAWASHREGGGRLVGLALRDVVAHCIGFDLPAGPSERRQRQAEWT